MNPKEVRSNWKIAHKEMTAEAMKMSFFVNREYARSKDEYSATPNDNFWALALAIRDRMVERWIHTQQQYHKENVKRVYYLSMEFLIGRLLGNNMYSLGLEDATAKALEDIGLDLEEIRDQEVDAGLGNGGLGRLAACFLDSMATLGIPAHGYGIRYDYGIFNQKIHNGYQIELPDEWLRLGTPWEFARPEFTVNIKLYGWVNSFKDASGKMVTEWKDAKEVLAVPYDIPVPGYKNDTVNTLRLWSARSVEDFDFEYFNSGDYEHAVNKKIESETISKVLYPNDAVSQGKELRLKQQYFFTAASIADIIRRFKSENDDMRLLPSKVVIQLNDTHPTLAVVELMRVLMDDYFLEWEDAWGTVTKTFAYTNHTLMPEALECWAVPLLERLLPRHMQIIYEINARFLKDVAKVFPGDLTKLKSMSLIDEEGGKKVRMAFLAVVSSFSVNGVSALHSDLLKMKVLRDFYEMYPQRFNNKTNGITQRRWLLKANPSLSSLISEAIGPQWITDLNHLSALAPLAKDAGFQQRWKQVKLANKQMFSTYLLEHLNIHTDPASMFDVQVKRIHEYKRQLLFIFYIIAQYLKLKDHPRLELVPRTYFIGGKAAPGYFTAKLIIKLANSVAQVINRDKDTHHRMKLVFLENYRVSLAERIFPASDLSEQISTAGTEASGTGNMKFMVNGALTIGTWDGANIEMAQQMGEDNMFTFGLRSHEVDALKLKGYDPQFFIRHSPVLERVIHAITSGVFSPDDQHLFDPIIQSILSHDTFMICADFDAYSRMQDIVSNEFKDQTVWVKKSILNVASSGFFSSDRTIAQYAKDIWGVAVIR